MIGKLYIKKIYLISSSILNRSLIHCMHMCIGSALDCGTRAVDYKGMRENQGEKEW